MENNNTFDDFFKKKDFENTENDFQIQDIKKSVDLALGTSLHKLKSFKKGRLDKFNSDYSEADHINTGNVTIRGAVISAVFSGLSLNTGAFGATKPVIDLSHESLVKSVEIFNDIAARTVEYQDILQFFSETFFNSPNIASYAFQAAIAAGTIATGMYVANGLKKNFEIEDICKDINKNVKHKNFTLEHASNVFQVLDNFYEYRRMAAVCGKSTKDFIKSIAAPVFIGLKNNINNPILNKVRDVIGEHNCIQLTNALKTLTPIIFNI